MCLVQLKTNENANRTPLFPKLESGVCPYKLGKADHKKSRQMHVKMTFY